MTQGLWTVAFAGSGPSTDKNTTFLLDNWLPETVNALALPVKIPAASKGLVSVRDWITAGYGEDGFDSVKDVVEYLLEAQKEGDEVYLVAAVSDPLNAADEELITRAIDAGIPVKDLNAALDDVSFEDIKPEDPPADPEPPAARRTAATRRTRPSQAAKAAETVSEPPKTRGRARRTEPDEPQDVKDHAGEVTPNPSGLPQTVEELAAFVDARIKLLFYNVGKG